MGKKFIEIIIFLSLVGTLSGCSKPEINLCQTGYTVELMTEMNMNLEDVVELDDISNRKKEKLKLDLSEIDTSTIGTYYGNVLYEDEVLISFPVEIVDTTAPVVKMKNEDIYYLQGETVLISDIIAEISDDSKKVSVAVYGGVTAQETVFGDVHFADVELVADELGSCCKEMVFRDASGNENHESFTLHVVNLPEIIAEDARIKQGDQEALENYWNSFGVVDELRDENSKVLFDASLVNINLPGTYSVELAYENRAGYKAQKTVNINIVEPPVIHASDVSIMQNQTDLLEIYWETIYAVDAIDGKVITGLNIDKSVVDITKVGVYKLPVSYTNSLGISSTVVATVDVFEETEGMRKAREYEAYLAEKEEIKAQYTLNTVRAGRNYFGMGILSVYYWSDNLNPISLFNDEGVYIGDLFQEYIREHPECGVVNGNGGTIQAVNISENNSNAGIVLWTCYD